MAEPTQPIAHDGETEPTGGPSGDDRPASFLSRALSSPRLPFFFLGAVVLAAAGYMLATKAPTSRLGFGGPAIVLFDPVKFSNAQRATVSMLQSTQSADMSLTMTQVAKHAEAVIREEANGAIVLVRQTVVAPDNLVDITDAVLLRFGLPTTVPTITTRPGEAVSLEQIAPTDSAFSSGKLREDYLLQLGERNARVAEQQRTQDSQTSVLP